MGTLILGNYHTHIPHLELVSWIANTGLRVEGNHEIIDPKPFILNPKLINPKP